MLENDFSEKLGEAYVHSNPQLWAFFLTYGQSIGWLCTIQESRFTSVHIGTGTTWHEAMDKALYDLKEHGRKEKADA